MDTHDDVFHKQSGEPQPDAAELKLKSCFLKLRQNQMRPLLWRFNRKQPLRKHLSSEDLGVSVKTPDIFKT